MIAPETTLRQKWKYWTVLAALPLAGLIAIPEARSEPHALAGAWSGGGVVVYATGGRERARCHANYTGGASTVAVNATCATPSGNVAQSARLRQTGANSYSGTFFNSQFNTNGSIRVVVHGNTQSVTITSGGGSASLTLHR